MSELSVYFKSVIEQDRCPVVICNLKHEIIYMNSAAMEKYDSHGNLVGSSIFDCHLPSSNEKICGVVEWFAKSRENNLVYTFFNETQNKDVYMVALRDESGELIGYYEKHEFRNPETMPKYCLK